MYLSALVKWVCYKTPLRILISCTKHMYPLYKELRACINIRPHLHFQSEFCSTCCVLHICTVTCQNG